MKTIKTKIFEKEFNSSSNPDVKYVTTKYDDNSFWCTCPGQKFNSSKYGKVCKHIKSLQNEK